MKRILLLFMALGLISCNQQTNDIDNLRRRIDSLETKLANTYKPGLGDFMGSIQTHHAKLWFAGQNENWGLADFEVHELEEAIEDIQKFHADREETQLIEILIPPLDSIDGAIERQDLASFERNYNALTIACNQCHQTVGYEFNVVQTPDDSPFGNQNFSLEK